MKLTEVNEDTIYRICDLSQVNRTVQKRLLDLGIVEGVEISYKHTMPFGGPYILEVSGQQLSLRKKDVQCIEVEEI